LNGSEGLSSLVRDKGCNPNIDNCSAVAADESGSKRERQELEEKFGQLRPEVLETLRTTINHYISSCRSFVFPAAPGVNNHASRAFVLAENYRDFRSLASLCHKGTTYPPENNPNAHRIQSYVEKFEDEFTTELYRWYIEQG
jgi:nuclear pore complex protein Nup133